jgi:hypothetical protein
MTVTAGSSITAAVGTASTTVSKSITSVPANATIVLAIIDRSDETTTISSISDDVNGAWTLSYVDGPVNSTASTYRSWLAYRNGCAAGTTNVTVTFSGAINSQLAANYIVSDQGAMTFDVAATTMNSGSATTTADSNTAAATGAGAIVGGLLVNNGQTDAEPTAAGAGESRLTTGQAGLGRAFLFFETYATSGNYGITSVCDSSGVVHIVGAFLEPGGGSNIPHLAAAYYYN